MSEMYEVQAMVQRRWKTMSRPFASEAAAERFLIAMAWGPARIRPVEVPT